jgi:flagellar basal body-associated protein FliL
MIRKLQAYVDNNGIKIEHIEPASKEDNVEFSYFGVAQMVTNFGQSEVRFVIPAASLEEAFSKYEEELKKFSDEMKRQISERQKAAANQGLDSTASVPQSES